MKFKTPKTLLVTILMLFAFFESQAFFPKIYFVQSLNLTSMCSDKPEQQRRWRVTNPNNFPVDITWEVYGTTQKGSMIAPAGESYFFTNTIGGGNPNTTKIYWKDASNQTQSVTKASGGVKCEESLDVCKTIFYIDEGVAGDGICHIYTVAIDETAKTATLKLFTTIPLDAAHFSLQPDGKRLYVIEEGNQNSFAFVDIATKSYNFVSKLNISHGITQVAFHPNGTLYFSSSAKDRVYLIPDVNNPVAEDLGQIQYENGYLNIEGADIAFTQSGDLYLSTIAYKGRIFHITGSKGALKAEKIGNERNRQITGLAITNNGKGNFIHSSHGKSEMSLLDIHTGNSIVDLKLQGDLTKMNWGDMSTSCMDKLQAENPLGGCAAVSVVDFKQGLNAGGKAVATDRSNPAKALGAPQGADAKDSFVSLGFGGYIILKFADAIVNGNGKDLKVVETSYGNPTCEKYPERVEAFASKDGVVWVSLGISCLDSEFDLGSLDWAQYVKLVDKSNPSDFPKDGDGYDVDGVVCLNGSKPVPVDNKGCGVTVGGNNLDLWKGVELKAKGFGDTAFSAERVGFVAENTMNSSIASGVGVKGQSSTEVSGYSTEIEFDATTGQSEVLSVGFGNKYTGAEITLGLFYGSESGQNAEQANVKAFDGDVEVGSFDVTSTSDLLVKGLPGFYTFKIKTTKPFNRLEFRGGGYKPVGGVAENTMRKAATKGDYIVNKITPSCEPLFECGNTVGGNGLESSWSKIKIGAKVWGSDAYTYANVAFEGGTGSNSGIGVKGGRFPEVDYNKLTKDSEALKLEFPSEMVGATITLKRFYGREDNNQSAETGHWIAYNANGQEVGNGEFKGTLPLGTDGTYEFTFTNNTPFVSLILKPGPYVAAGNTANTDYIPDNSDFLLNKIIPICRPFAACGETIGGNGLANSWANATMSAKVWGSDLFSSDNVGFDGGTSSNSGVGVKGGRFPEVDYNKLTKDAEMIQFDFKYEFTGASVTLKRFYGRENNNQSAETGHWIAYNAKGEEVGNGEFKGVLPLGTDGTFQFNLKSNAPFTRLRFVPGPYVAAGNTANTDQIPDNSDFLINKITPTCDPIVPVVPQADLAVTQTADKTSLKVGDEVNFTITVTNNGPFTAGNATQPVKLSNTLPAGFSLLSVTGSTFVSNIAELGSLDINASKTIVVKAKAVKEGNYVNSVNVTAANPEDPNFSNNNASVNIVVNPADVKPICVDYDLSVTAASNVSSTDTTGIIVYTINVTNLKGSAPGVVVQALFNNPVNVISATDDTGASYPDPLNIRLGDLTQVGRNFGITYKVAAKTIGTLNAAFNVAATNASGKELNDADNHAYASVSIVAGPQNSQSGTGSQSSNDASVKVYPNPFIETITVEFGSEYTGTVNVQVYNISNAGTVYNISRNVENVKTLSVDLPSSLAPGMYVLKVNKSGGATPELTTNNPSIYSIGAKEEVDEQTFKVYKDK